MWWLAVMLWSTQLFAGLDQGREPPRHQSTTVTTRRYINHLCTVTRALALIPRYQVSEIAKGKSYSYPPRFLFYICICRDHIWPNFININLYLNWHWTLALNRLQGCTLNFAVLYLSIRGVRITGLCAGRAFVLPTCSDPYPCSFSWNIFVIRDMRLNYCETVRYR